MKTITKLLFFISIFLGNSYVVSLELEEKKQLEECFLEACKIGNLEEIESCIAKKVNINCTDEEGNTGLILLLENLDNYDHINIASIIKLLIKNNLKINLMNLQGKPAIYYACNIPYSKKISVIERHISIIKLLLDNLADPVIDCGINVVFEFIKKFMIGFLIIYLPKIKNVFNFNEEVKKIIKDFENEFKNFKFNSYSDIERNWNMMKKFYFFDLHYAYSNHFNEDYSDRDHKYDRALEMANLFDSLNETYKKFQIKKYTQSSLRTILLPDLGYLVSSYL